MLHEHHGIEMMEYVIIGALIVAVIGGTLYALMQTIGTKLQTINVQIGS